MTDDDADLVALIDNELDENRKKALLARLETDEGLRERYEALRQTGAPIAASFEALLRQAPIARCPSRAPPARRRDDSRALRCATSQPESPSAWLWRAWRRGWR
jgi:anti-sigma factor RsiW